MIRMHVPYRTSVKVEGIIFWLESCKLLFYYYTILLAVVVYGCGDESHSMYPRVDIFSNLTVRKVFRALFFIIITINRITVLHLLYSNGANRQR